MRVVILLGLFLLCLIPISANACLAAQDASASTAAADTAVVRTWIRDHAIALTTVEAGNGFADLQPLREIAGDARIVALGEAGHGTREFFQLKHRLLEFLVSEMGFNILAMEVTFPEALDVNRYVLTGEGDPARALAGLHFWIYDTKEVLALIRWMREYNLNETSGRKVKFYGFDQQYRSRAARTVLDFLRRVDPVSGRAAERILEPLADPSPFLSVEIEGATEDVRREVVEALLLMAGDFDDKMDSYAAGTSVEEADLVHQHLEILLQNMGAEGLTRDAAMAENVAWILDHEGPDSKAVLWAHNQHLAVREGSQGEDLRRRYGDDYRVVGFTSDRGGIQARDAMRDGELLPWFVESAPDTTLEAQMRAAAPAVALIDLRSLPETGPVTSWFKSAQSMRLLGMAYNYEHPEWFWWTAPVADVYDALAFVEETTPARANLTGRVPGWDLHTSPANLDFEVGLPGGWPLGWRMPRGAALVEWDVRLSREDAKEGKQAVVIRRVPGPSYGEAFGQLSQRIEASPWRGRRVTLRAWARIDDAAGRPGHLWLEVTEQVDSHTESVFMGNRPSTGSEWREYRISADVSQAAHAIEFGFVFAGEGEAWVDDVSLEVHDEPNRPGKGAP